MSRRNGLALAIHGGAGAIERAALLAERDAELRAGLCAALDAGWAVLEADGDALTAVAAAVVVLEDCDVFNAGRGSVLREDGTAVMDASVMRGSDRAGGAVAAVRRIRNPVLAAREVLREGRHVLLVAGDAEALAARRGLALVDPRYFLSQARVAQLERAQRAGGTRLDHDENVVEGTVGAVARDAHGGLAAATSTGGMTNASPARVGDSPILGAGTWADDTTCAVSGTGVGECFIRSAFAHEVHAGVRLGGLELEVACASALRQVHVLGGRGGCVAVDRAGTICLPFDTLAMPRASRVEGGPCRVAIFADEPLPEM